MGTGVHNGRTGDLFGPSRRFLHWDKIYRWSSSSSLWIEIHIAAFGISGSKKRGLAALFATHPDLDDRIRALAESTYPDFIS
jgi:Zn-dependent protease with chaperone function